VTTPTPTLPSAPSNLTAEAVSASQVELHWFDNSNDEEGFRIYRDNALIATVGINVTLYQDSDLEPATTYQYTVKANNEVGESGASMCTIRTPNPPVTVRLDRIGVYDNGEHWLRGEDGEVYIGIIVTDGNTAVEKRFLQEEGQFYHLRENEIADVGAIVFSVDEVGDDLRIAAVGYENDGGPGETLIYKALGAAIEAYLSGGSASLLEMTDFSLGNILAKLFGAEDDWLGSYENAWDSYDNWGIGRYTDIACEEEDGTLGLRLWFTIENPMEPLASTPTPTLTPTATPTPKPTATPTPTPAPLSINFNGWYVNGSQVTTASKDDTVVARISLTGGHSEQYTIRIKRDIRWAGDSIIKEFTFNYDGVSATKEISFIPPYATDEASTNGYFLVLVKDSNEIWGLDNAYPPRLRVSTAQSVEITTLHFEVLPRGGFSNRAGILKVIGNVALGEDVSGEISVTAGGNKDIMFSIQDPFGNTIYTYLGRVVESANFSIVAQHSGTYTLIFDNSFSVATRKSVELELWGGTGWLAGETE